MGGRITIPNLHKALLVGCYINDTLQMLKKIACGLFVFLVLAEIGCRLTDYAIANGFLDIILKSYLTIFILVTIILFLSNLPKPFAVGLTIVLLLSGILFLKMALPSLTIGTAGHSSVTKMWSGDNFRVENIKGQGWAGPNYDNFILYKTRFLGLVKKEISLVPASRQNDSCLVTFSNYSNGDTIFYLFDNCKKELKLMKDNHK